jgi:hypothetical protein
MNTQIFAFVFKVKPESGHYSNVNFGYANVYVKADNLIEARLRATILVKDAHWDVLEMLQDGTAHYPLTDDPHPLAKDLLQHAKEHGTAIRISGVGVDPIDAGYFP